MSFNNLYFLQNDILKLHIWIYRKLRVHAHVAHKLRSFNARNIVLNIFIVIFNVK